MARGESIGNPAPYAVRAIQEGLSGRAALRELREAGGAISDRTWFRVYGEARASIQNMGPVAGMAMGTVPRDEHFVDWSAGQPGQFAYQFQVVTVDSETGIRGSRPHTVITDSVISLDAAADQAMSDLQAADAQGAYGNVPIAPIPVNLFRMTGPA